ncbi:MAG: hypothetical protein SFZ03_00565 [Candidatus Melainabacteria bacterium]|nr:hypothetical protein [Candidatus Melainabacteria bacterium]
MISTHPPRHSIPPGLRQSPKPQELCGRLNLTHPEQTASLHNQPQAKDRFGQKKASPNNNPAQKNKAEAKPLWKMTPIKEFRQQRLHWYFSKDRVHQKAPQKPTGWQPLQQALEKVLLWAEELLDGFLADVIFLLHSAGGSAR